ncbi:hypothetical protein ACJX0J_004409 (mitochondrion) [Zea mays]
MADKGKSIDEKTASEQSTILIVEYKPVNYETEVFFSILRDHWDDLVNIGLSSLLEIAVNPSGKEKLYLHNESAVSDHLFDLFAISNIEGWPVTKLAVPGTAAFKKLSI